MAEDVTVTFGANLGPLIEGMSKIKESVDGIGEKLNHVAELFGIAFTVDAIKEFIASMAELGERTEHTMAILGASADQVATLATAARLTGTGTEELVSAFSRLQLGLAQAQDGTGRVKGALDALGVSVTQFRAMSMDKQIQTIAEKFSGWADGANKTAIAQALLGRSGAELIPMLDKGAEGWERYAQLVKALLPDQEKFTEGAAQTQEKIATLQLAILGMGEKMFNVLKPAIDGAISWMTGLIKSFDEGTMQAAFNKVMSVILDIVGAIIAAVEKVAELVGRLIDLLKGLENAAKAPAAAWDFALVKFSDALSVIGVGPGMTAIRSGTDAAAASAQTLGQKWDGVSESVKRTLNLSSQLNANQRFWQFPNEGAGGEHHDEKKALPQAPQLVIPSGASQDNDALNAAIKAAQDEVRAYADAFNMKKALLDQYVAYGKITNQQSLQSQKDYLDDELGDEQDTLRRELLLPGLKLKQIQQINDQIEQVQRSHDLKIVQIDTEIFKANVATVRGFIDPVTSAFNSQLSGLLQGTTKFKDAMRSIFQELTIDIIKWLEEWGVKHAATMIANALTTTQSEAAQTAATTAGVAARNAAEASGASVTMASTFAKYFAQIEAAAAATYANVFAWASPIMGPFAVVPAIAAAGLVAAQAALIPSLAVGTSMLPADMLISAHQGEMVVPAFEAGQFRNALGALGGGGGGGGGNVSLTLQAWDGGSVDRWLKGGGAAQILKHINSAMALNPTLRPGY